MAIPKLALIPSGVKAGKLYSVLPTNGDGDFTTTRNTVATRVNENGLIEEVASNVPRLDYSDGGCPSLLLEPTSTNLIKYSEEFANVYWLKTGSSIQGDPSTEGTEEITNGDFATDSDWTKGTGWTIAGGVASSDGTNSPLDQFSITTIGKTYKVDITVINMTTSSVNVRLGGGSSDIIGSIESNGTYTFYGTVANSTTFRIRANTGFDGSIDNVSVKEVQGFVSPSGTTSAFKLVEDNANSRHRLASVAFPVTNEENYSISVFAKYSGRPLQIFTGASAGNLYANFDLQNGTLGSKNSISSNITSLSNGWYRCDMSFEAISTGNMDFSVITVLAPTSAIASTYQGDGTSGVYIYGAQLEEQSYATSYIKNEGTAAGITRAADSANGAGNASTFNDSEGVLMAEISALEDDLTFRRLTISDNSYNNTIDILLTNNSNEIRVLVRDNTVTTSQMSYTVNSVVEFNKIAFKYKSTSSSLWVNGLNVVNIADIFTLPFLTDLSFDRGDGTSNFYGNIKQIQYFDSALNDSDLETLTSWTSFTAMANAQSYTII